MRSVCSILDLSVEDLDQLLNTANDIIANPEAYWDKCAHKKLATLFFEPSTRTRLSFEAAMLELGGSVIGFSEASSSSASKGETMPILWQFDIPGKARLLSHLRQHRFLSSMPVTAVTTTPPKPWRIY